jgi:hypothetical protein
MARGITSFNGSWPFQAGTFPTISSCAASGFSAMWSIVPAENSGALAAMRWRRPSRSIGEFNHNFPASTEAASIALASAIGRPE